MASELESEKVAHHEHGTHEVHHAAAHGIVGAAHMFRGTLPSKRNYALRLVF